jgi:hypothetical protein
MTIGKPITVLNDHQLKTTWRFNMNTITIGFEHIYAATIETIIKDVMMEGTCWLAYDRYQDYVLEKIYELQPEIKAVHNDAKDTDSEIWSDIDIEIIEFIGSIPMAMLAQTGSVHWCMACHTISNKPIICDHTTNFGYTVTDVEVI